jgi:hypothetical protein
LAPAASVPLAQLIVVVPAVAVTVPVLHVPPTFGVGATCNPPVNVSLNATPLKAVPEFGFVIVNVSVVIPFSGMLVGLNDLLMVGGDKTAVTVKVADTLLLVSLP